MSRRGGLGRGLAALIPPGEEGTAGRVTLAQLPLAAVVANPRQPREVFDEQELEGLATSIRDLGVLQPVVVRPAGEDRFELVAGERRLRAATMAGLERIPAVVRHTDDGDLLKEALVENIHRVQLNPLEEAAAYQQLLEEFGFTQEELPASLGRSRPVITNTLRLLALPAAVQRRVAAGVLSSGHAKAVLALADADAQERLATRIVAEGLSVRATEELVRLRLPDGGDEPLRPASRRGVMAPGLIELQDDLSDALQARVRISMGARKGKLQIEFASVDDLERVVGVVARGLDPGAGDELAGRHLQGEATGVAEPATDEPASDGSSEAELDAVLDAADGALDELDLDELEAMTRPDRDDQTPPNAI